jgi:RHS repeat-associated protein
VTLKNSGGTTIETYKYDGLNHRIVEAPGSTTRDLYYSDQWQVLEERLNGSSNADVQYIWSPTYVDALILRDRSTAHNGTLDERLWVEQDANYNVTALVNGSGSVVERYAYDPFGVQSIYDGSWNSRSSSSYAFIYGFQSLRMDTTTGNNNARNREDRPTIDRFLQSDPEQFGAGDTNFYRLVGDNPTNATDPSGLSETTHTFWVKDPAVKKSINVAASFDGFSEKESAILISRFKVLCPAAADAAEAIANSLVLNDEALRDLSKEDQQYWKRIRRQYDRVFRGYDTDSLSKANYEQIDRVLGKVWQGMRLSTHDGHDPIPLVREEDDRPESYAWVAFGKIHLGPGFFTQSPRQQAAILFHEMTHLYADTKDHFYKQYNRANEEPKFYYVHRDGTIIRDLTESVTTEKCVRNANNYERFLKAYYLGALSDKPADGRKIDAPTQSK